MINNKNKPITGFEPAVYGHFPERSELEKVIAEIKHLKGKLAELFEVKGLIDQEILDLAAKIDDLLNEYDQLLQKA